VASDRWSVVSGQHDPGKIDGRFDILLNPVEILINDPTFELVDRLGELGKVL